MTDDIVKRLRTVQTFTADNCEELSLITDEAADEIVRLRAEMQQVRLDHITTLGELQEAAAEIEWLKEALTDAQNETRRG